MSVVNNRTYFLAKMISLASIAVTFTCQSLYSKPLSDSQLSAVLGKGCGICIGSTSDCGNLGTQGCETVIVEIPGLGGIISCADPSMGCSGKEFNPKIKNGYCASIGKEDCNVTQKTGLYRSCMGSCVATGAGLCGCVGDDTLGKGVSINYKDCK